MNRGQLRQWARIGAAARLRELDAETAEIRRAFRGLRGTGHNARGFASADPVTPARRKRRTMSAAGRAAIVAAARKRWAEWRKKKDGLTA